jgi:hypothetical protein
LVGLKNGWSKESEGMTALGHKRPIFDGREMSALPPKADIQLRRNIGRYGPLATFCVAERQRPSKSKDRRDAIRPLIGGKY